MKKLHTKYAVPGEGWTYSLRTIGALWRLHKSMIKKDRYMKYTNDDDKIKNKPDVISLEEFKVLLKYWVDEKVQVYIDKLDITSDIFIV